MPFGPFSLGTLPAGDHRISLQVTCSPSGCLVSGYSGSAYLIATCPTSSSCCSSNGSSTSSGVCVEGGIDDFESYPDGYKSFGWNTENPAQIKAGVGNPGKAIELAQIPTAIIYKEIQASSDGSFSFDVFPAQETNGAGRVIELKLGSEQYTQALSPINIALVVGSSPLYFSSQNNNWIYIGNPTLETIFMPNEWQNIKVQWHENTNSFDLYLNGTNIGSASNPTPAVSGIDNVAIIAANNFFNNNSSIQSTVFYLDNVSKIQ